MTGGLGYFLGGHAIVLAQLNAPQTLDIAFDGLRRMERLLSDLAGRFMLHESLVAYYGFVRYGSSKIMNRAAPRDHVPGIAFMSTDDSGNSAYAPVQEQGDVRIAENGMLLMGLLEESQDAVLANGLPAAGRAGIVDVFGSDEIEDDRNQLGVLDALVAGGRNIGGDS